MLVIRKTTSKQNKLLNFTLSFTYAPLKALVAICLKFQLKNSLPLIVNYHYQLLLMTTVNDSATEINSNTQSYGIGSNSSDRKETLITQMKTNDNVNNINSNSSSNETSNEISSESSK